MFLCVVCGELRERGFTIIALLAGVCWDVDRRGGAKRTVEIAVRAFASICRPLALRARAAVTI